MTRTELRELVRIRKELHDHAPPLEGECTCYDYGARNAEGEYCDFHWAIERLNRLIEKRLKQARKKG